MDRCSPAPETTDMSHVDGVEVVHRRFGFLVMVIHIRTMVWGV